MSFSTLGLSEPIVRAVSERGYTEPTPIQMQAIPAVLSGGDLMAGAQTGTGKTAGFTLPILQRLSTTSARREGAIRALVLTPTRELAAQVEESVRRYGQYLDINSMVMFGGVSINPQIDQLKGRVDILVCTPGRLLDHVQQKTVSIADVEILVLDEADRMLDMGFIRDIKKVLALLPKQRQNLLFSATFSDEIKELADGLLNSPAMIEVARRNATAEAVEQKVIFVEQPVKRAVLAHLIKEKAWFQVLVFTRTKHGANRLAEYLAKQEIPSLAIHGNKSQNARTRALAEFKSNKLQVLVATDIAARGLDISELPHVVNFELPNVPEDYVHRIGRTGRAGASGEALSLVSRDEKKLLADIEKLIKRELPRIEVEDFDMEAALATAAANRQQDEARPPREPRQRREGQGKGQGQQRRGEGQRARGDAQPVARAEGGQPRPEGPPRREGPPKGDGQPRRRGGGQGGNGSNANANGGGANGGQRRERGERGAQGGMPQNVQQQFPSSGDMPAAGRRARPGRGGAGNKQKGPRIVYPRDENGDVNGNVVLPEFEKPEVNGNVIGRPERTPPEVNGNRADGRRGNGGGGGRQGGQGGQRGNGGQGGQGGGQGGNGGNGGGNGNRRRRSGKGGEGGGPRNDGQSGGGQPQGEKKKSGLRGAISRGINAIRRLTD
ncbi:DEAD/DEAH box helicase [Uliginosibacterium sp. H1]|uniref:DEAD/DEAH box helicase n=1 Tax=Uliginosibacterium sp. H1 TaxID=3114757 RepID=UPI002E182DFE|nr:DEAD/DEAH box helicase [Uliginosibacterium sp. H1]